MELSKLIENLHETARELEVNAFHLEILEKKENEIFKLKNIIKEKNKEINRLKDKLTGCQIEKAELKDLVDEQTESNLSEERLIEILKKQLKKGSRWFHQEFYELAEQSILV